MRYQPTQFREKNNALNNNQNPKEQVNKTRRDSGRFVVTIPNSRNAGNSDPGHKQPEGHPEAPEHERCGDQHPDSARKVDPEER
jgi:hypothetical protein